MTLTGARFLSRKVEQCIYMRQSNITLLEILEELEGIELRVDVLTATK